MVRSAICFLLSSISFLYLSCRYVTILAGTSPPAACTLVVHTSLGRLHRPVCNTNRNSYIMEASSEEFCDDLMFLILAWLPPDQLLAVTSTSKRWHHLAHQPESWRRTVPATLIRLCRKWSESQSVQAKEAGDDSNPAGPHCHTNSNDGGDGGRMLLVAGAGPRPLPSDSSWSILTSRSPGLGCSTVSLLRTVFATNLLCNPTFREGGNQAGRIWVRRVPQK